MGAECENAQATRAIVELGRQLEPEIIGYRRFFHAHPELSNREFATQQRICDELDALGVPYRKAAGTGVIATIAGQAKGAYDDEGRPVRRVALRADIDALPVTERTDLAFASEAAGVMHACGHDCHIAMMLGTVRMLLALRPHLRGEVRILFQPAEEVSQGARAMIADGAIEGVDAIYGAHIWSEVDAGAVSCEPGRRMAHTDWFRIDITGASAHGSMPHKGVDAVVVGAEMVTALQVLVSRDVSPFEPVVVTVGEFHGGEARNVMAGTAYLTGTVRTWSDALREEVPDRLERIVGKIAHAFNAECAFTFEHGNSGLSNTPEYAEACRKAVVKVLGEDAVASYEGSLAGEDFSEYLKHVPGVLAFVGGRNPELGCDHPQHSCFFNIDESSLVKGSMVAAQWAVDQLA